MSCDHRQTCEDGEGGLMTYSKTRIICEGNDDNTGTIRVEVCDRCKTVVVVFSQTQAGLEVKLEGETANE